MASVADGELLPSLAREGGFRSVLWAGPELLSDGMRTGEVSLQGAAKRREPIALKLGFSSDLFSYTVELGLPPQAPGSNSMFLRDPEIKRECMWLDHSLEAKKLCADRRRTNLRVRRENQAWHDIELGVGSHSSMLTEYSDPFQAPEILVMRDYIRSWRFYDSFRVDALAPARQVQVGTLTTVMSDDGSDFVAALQTIREIGDHTGLDEAIHDAFPGTQVRVEQTDHGMKLLVSQPGMLRDLSAAELSDGTLRYLLLVTALLTPRPPALMVLNEPESSLHPDLLPALGRLIINATRNSQVLVVTHAEPLVQQLADHEDVSLVRLERSFGETICKDANLLDKYGWLWPKR